MPQMQTQWQKRPGLREAEQLERRNWSENKEGENTRNGESRKSFGLPLIHIILEGVQAPEGNSKRDSL